jgi:2-polyprenyl-3-methyl-5-hydroxy-6-metoxy-1,4-benzoquinol methylase
VAARWLSPIMLHAIPILTYEMNYYADKSEIYFTGTRNDLISFLPSASNLHVLELGAGGGDTLVALKRAGKASRVVGIELFKLQNSLQEDPLIDQFILGNIEEIDLQLEPNSFDAVLMGDVLEHLLDPWSTIKKISALIKPGGYMIASIPNVRSREALKKIFLRGDFAYTTHGLFDKTHYRWFCKKNMVELMTPAGFSLTSVTSNLDLKKGSRTKVFNRLTGRAFEEFLTVQFITVSQKTNA